MGSDCISSRSVLIFLLCVSELLCVCHAVALQVSPYIHLMLLFFQSSGALKSLLNIPVPLYLFDTVLKVIN